MGKEIISVNLLQLVKSRYDVLITDAVVIECNNSKDEKLIRSIDGLPIASKRDEKFLRITDFIKRIDFRLGSGEIECIASSILMTHLGIENYVVIDERLARKIVSKVHTSPELIKIICSTIPPIKCTGTIGIVKHLYDKGVLSKEECQKIAYDLESSDFRITDELLNLIR
jgi:predicted nucleic acid-binding protein